MVRSSTIQIRWHSRLAAPAIGIAVDFRRQNPSEESHAANVACRTAYKERLMVLPRKGTKHPKAGDSKDIDLSRAQTVSSASASLPIIPVGEGISEIKKSDIPAAIEDGACAALCKREATRDWRVCGKAGRGQGQHEIDAKTTRHENPKGTTDCTGVLRTDIRPLCVVGCWAAMVGWLLRLL
ncbi:hypothetical protein F4823DRAFT_567010 [Ustulina deusta]|nr:hypothetical protein F4823DRAFT_567010 [Ustulina deusta]